MNTLTKIYSVYIVVNVLNEKVYVGQTNDADKRRLEHFADSEISRSSHKPLYVDIKKFGKDAFAFSVLSEFDNRDSALEEEENLIKMYKDIGVVVYNLSNGVGQKGIPATAETVERIANLNRGKKLTPEHKALLASFRVGSVTSDETKAKQSKALKGRKLSIEQVESMKGERNARSKLTWAKVREIRALYMAGGTTHLKLAKQFGVCKAKIAQVLSNKCWKE